MLGQEFGLQIASPLFVALSEHPIETVPSALVVRHEEVDPDELKLQQENEERKRVLEERRRTFNELLDVGGIDAYKTALDIAGFSSKSVDNYSYERDIRHSQGFNFDGFLPDDQVLELAARNARASPFQLDLLMNKAYEREKIDVFLAIVIDVSDRITMDRASRRRCSWRIGLLMLPVQCCESSASTQIPLLGALLVEQWTPLS